MTTSRSVRLLVIVILSAATALMAGVSLRANYLFGYGFGQSEEKAVVFGWANVAADLWKMSGLIVITGLWRAQQKRFAISLVPIWVLCLLWGLIGAVGVYAQDRTTLIGGRDAIAATYNDAKSELAEVEAKLRTLTRRTVGQVEAGIAAVLARPVMQGERVRGTVGKLSSNCTNDDRATAEACLEVAALREERAAAEVRVRLERRQAALRSALTKLREEGGSLAADPVAEVFAWLSRGLLSVRDIGFGFPLFFAFLIEIVSAFGPAGIVAYADATRAGGSRPQPAAAGRSTLIIDAASEQGSVVTWLLERGAPADGGRAIAAKELHADYELWCRRNHLAAMGLEAFIVAFDDMRDDPDLALTEKIRKFGTRYYGIRLIENAIVSHGR